MASSPGHLSRFFRCLGLFLIFLCIAQSINCFSPRNNPYDPQNPNADDNFKAKIDFHYSSIDTSFSFYLDSARYEVFRTVWRLYFSEDNTDNFIDTVDGASLYWKPRPTWNHRCRVIAEVIAMDGSRGADTLNIETQWTAYTKISSSLPDDSITAVAIDSSKNLWFGTKGGSLVLFTGYFWKLINTRNKYGVGPFDNSISIISTICIDRHGSVWAVRKSSAMWGSWVYFDPLSGWMLPVDSLPQIEQYYYQFENYSMSICKDTIYIARSSDWLVWGEIQPGRPLFVKAVDQIDTKLSLLSSSATGTLWGATKSGIGLIRIRNRIPDPIFNTQNSPLFTDTIISLLADNNDSSVWVGTKSGLGHFSIDECQRYYTGEQIRAISRDNYGNIWVGTAGFGLHKLRPDGTDTTFNRANSSLRSDTINAIAIDGQRKLWLGTTRGLVRLYDLSD